MTEATTTYRPALRKTEFEDNKPKCIFIVPKSFSDSVAEIHFLHERAAELIAGDKNIKSFTCRKSALFRFEELCFENRVGFTIEEKGD
jgi:hypothetical protein